MVNHINNQKHHCQNIKLYYSKKKSNNQTMKNGIKKLDSPDYSFKCRYYDD